jgi:hypothetical protein
MAVGAGDETYAARLDRSNGLVDLQQRLAH